MTCQLHRRLQRLSQLASQVSERITIWHPRAGTDTVQVSVSTDPVAASGNGDTICSALSDLEQMLGLEPLAECGECEPLVGSCADTRAFANAEIDPVLAGPEVIYLDDTE